MPVTAKVTTTRPLDVTCQANGHPYLLSLSQPSYVPCRAG